MRPTSWLTAFVCVCLLHASAFSQCLPVINDTAACTGTEPLVTNNEIIGAGTTKWYYGVATTLTSLRIQSGGKLIVCGELQVNDFGMTGGTLVITRTGRLTVNTGSGASMVFNGGCSVYNLGFFKLFCNLVLDGVDAWTNPVQPNIIWNGPGARFDMPHTYFVLEKGNCFFVNKGTANFSGIINGTLSDSASVCLGNMSRMYVSLLENRKRSSYVAPDGPACVFVRSWGYSYEQLTLWPSVFVCRSASYCLGGCDSVARQNQKWGSATLFNSCTACAGIYLLPVKFTSVQLMHKEGSLTLSWKVDHLPDHSQFTIQRSHDGISFENIDSIVSMTSVDQGFSYADRRPLNGRSFYRIVLTHADNGYVVSTVLSTNIENIASAVRILPNPFTNECTIELPQEEQLQEIKLFTITGKIVHHQTIRKQTRRITIHPQIPAGNYFAQIITDGKIYNLKLVKKE